MKIHVCNRQQAGEFDPLEHQTQAVISIHTPGDPPADLQEGWEHTLRLEFHDVAAEYPSFKFFTPEMADQIHEFIERDLNRDFMVHCDAGFSRSVGVAVFMRDIHGAGIILHSTQALHGANGLVIARLKEKAWLEQLNRRKT